MLGITLAQAGVIVDEALACGARMGLQPLTVAVLDPGGYLVALKRQDDSGILRPQLAVAKAWGVLGMGLPARDMARRAAHNPQFFGVLSELAEGRVVPVLGGVPVRDAEHLLGAVGITGDTSENDEACAVAGIGAAGLRPWLDHDDQPEAR
ncbi:MAG: GlcG/HbpS family heme-binding protein [Acidimicrobiales bacterium]